MSILYNWEGFSPLFAWMSQIWYLISMNAPESLVDASSTIKLPTPESLQKLRLGIVSKLALLGGKHHNIIVNTLEDSLWDEYISTPINDTTQSLLGHFWSESGRTEEMNSAIKFHDKTAKAMHLEESVIAEELYHRGYDMVKIAIIILAFRERKIEREQAVRIERESKAAVEKYVQQHRRERRDAARAKRLLQQIKTWDLKAE